MSRFTPVFTVGIFIVFLAVLFHYFCRVRKKPELIVQQQVHQVPEGYVYPIRSSIAGGRQLVLAPNFGHYHGPFVTASSMPYPVAAGPQYAFSNNRTGMNSAPPAYPPRSDGFSNPARPTQPDDDLPPPYHVAVATAAPQSQS